MHFNTVYNSVKRSRTILVNIQRSRSKAILIHIIARMTKAMRTMKVNEHMAEKITKRIVH